MSSRTALKVKEIYYISTAILRKSIDFGLKLDIQEENAD